MILKLIRRTVLLLIGLELLYLLLFNAALNLKVTQRLINAIKPETFQISWEKAWTPYPFEIYVGNGSAWGSSSSQKWKVIVHQARARISILPLLQHRVKVYDIDAVNISYFQRPTKVSAEKANLKPHFAPLASVSSKKKPSQATSTKKVSSQKEKKAWEIDLEDIDAKGEHAFWVYQAKGDFSGDVHIDRLNIATNNGPFSIAKARIDILMDTLQIGEKKGILTQSRIHGETALEPIVFSQNKGAKILSFLSLDTTIESHMGNLDLLNVYLHRMKGTKISGEGKLQGHIVFDKGVLLPGTDAKIEAERLMLSAKGYKVKGEGQIICKVRSEDTDRLDAHIIFNTLRASVSQKHSDITLFRGKTLTLKAKGSPRLIPVPPKKEILTYLSVDVPSVIVDDIAAFQRFIPEKWSFSLKGGEGEFHAKALIEKDNAFFDAQLLAKKAKIILARETFQSGLDLRVKLDAKTISGPTEQRITADISGSHIFLIDSIIADPRKKSKKWNTDLNISQSKFTVSLPKEYNASMIDTLDMKKLLSTANATLKVDGSISQFDWLNIILKNSLNLDLSGRGKIAAELKLANGLPQQGSRISIVPQDLKIGLLDYTFAGDGHLLFDVTEGGETPSMTFDITLNDATMKRRKEKQAMIEHVQAALKGKIQDLDLKKPKKEMELHLQISSAKVKNITIYNSYIPTNSPFKLTKGTADMKADILLASHSAKGYVKLNTHNLEMKIDDQKISARLSMDLKINSGIPKKMAFDIAGSTIVLDQAKVQGNTVNYKQTDWYAKVKLKKADIVWRKPIKLHSETALQIKDSRPIVAMMDNKKEKHNWLSKLMTITDIRGSATVNMANNVIAIPHAFVKSDKIDIGAKGIISSTLREGMFYLRYKKLKLLLKLKNGKKNLDIFHVQKTFDNYVLPFQE